MVRKKLTLILFTAALAQNLQVIKQRMAKAAQGGDLTNLVKMKTEKKTYLESGASLGTRRRTRHSRR
jgi:hypothetical protein